MGAISRCTVPRFLVKKLILLLLLSLVADGDTEIKLVIAAVYSNFRTYIVDDEGIEQTDGYTCGPTKNKLFLRFERVSASKSHSL